MPTGEVMKLLIALYIILLTSTAHALEATWYSVESLKKEGSWAIWGGVMKNGKPFDEKALTCATHDYPLGSKVLVRRVGSKKQVIVRVTDRTARRFKGKRIDLTPAAFRHVARRGEGMVRVVVRGIKDK